MFLSACAWAEDVTDFVDPMIGTVGTGHTFPGPCRPFGLVQPSPDTGNGRWKYCSGYAGDDTVIRRFSQTHLNGTGQAGLGDVGLLPFAGERPENPCAVVASFAKDNERAVLGKYEVLLDDGTRVEISAGRRLAHYRLRFPKGKRGHVLLDFPYGLYRQPGYLPFLTTSCRVARVSAARLEGANHSEVFAPRDVFYAVDLQPAPVSLDELPKQAADKGPRYLAEYAAGAEVEVRIALSSRSLAGAWRNFAAECGTPFDQRVAETVAEWKDYLSRISLDGLSNEEKISVCTALYRLFIQPNVISDVDEKVRYSTFSLWDTFRDAHPLYERLVPELVVPFVDSLLDHYDQWGYLPQWELWGRETGCMIGSHAVPVIVRAYQNGFRGFDVAKAYEAVKATLTHEGRPGAGKVYPRRTDWDVYNRYGYYPFDIVPRESVSRTLECSFDDFLAAQFARTLGKDGDAAFFERRSWSFTNLFDRTTLCFRGRDSEGNWREPFESADVTSTPDYTEGSALQWSWSVLHRPEWLIDAMGGQESFERRLDAFFDGSLYPDVARHNTQDVTGLIGDYAHGNEPCHHVPDLYRLIGRPEKAEGLVRRIVRVFYRARRDGLCGNDDCGQMSAWYLARMLNLGVARGGVVQSKDVPTALASASSTTFDFGRDAFGWLEIDVPEGVCGPYEVRLGECVRPDGRVDLNPGGTIRAACVTGMAGRAGWMRIPVAADVRNTQGVNAATARQVVRLPEEFGTVMPFRYAEVVNAPFRVATNDVRRTWLHWDIDESASLFDCSDARLRQVYDFCKYTIVATSFAGLYVDGDRERIPYEADAYINQLGHYAIDSDFRMARATFRRLVSFPTWPTEWKQHMIMMAWTDWMWSGSIELARASYDLLKNEKLLLVCAREDGLVVTGGTRHPFPPRGNDIVDWPTCERDGFEVRPVNAVVNAFHHLNLLQMADLAAALGKASDARFFGERAERVRQSYQRAFFDHARGVYVDGEGASHASLHANAAALACGLVPETAMKNVADFLERKGMACSVYFAQYLLDALAVAGRDEALVRLMTASGSRSWLGMLEQGATMTMEAWNLEVKPNQDWNHAWGTSPLNVIVRHVLGVTPREPGFSKISIRPRLGGLKWVKGVVPTRKGPVVLQMSEDALSVEVPAPSVVMWKGKVHEVTSGRHAFK